MYLIPWLGPHVTFLISTLWQPVPIDMQSSPESKHSPDRSNRVNLIARIMERIEELIINYVHTRGYEWIVYFQIVRLLQVNSVCVGTICRCFYANPFYMHVFAHIERHMKLGAVLNSHSSYRQLETKVETYRLHLFKFNENVSIKLSFPLLKVKDDHYFMFTCPKYSGLAIIISNF